MVLEHAGQASKGGQQPTVLPAMLMVVHQQPAWHGNPRTAVVT